MNAGRAPIPAAINVLKRRGVAAALSLVFLTAPLLLTSYPPSADLPQHLAQIRLFLEARENAESPYEIKWTAPNTLVYLPVYIFWKILPPEYLGRALLLLIASLWIIAIHVLSAKRGASAGSAVLASLLLFNHAFYWGFLNFLVGFPVFVAWFLVTSKDRDDTSLRHLLSLTVVSFLLYTSHALWLVAGSAWLVIGDILEKTRWKAFFLRLAALLPIVVAATLWFIRFAPSRAASGFDLKAIWPSHVFDRLAFSWFVDSAFGGIWGPMESVVFLCLYIWLAASVWRYRSELRRVIDKGALAAGLLFLGIVLIAPAKYMNTIFFSSRWFPVATVFFLITIRLPWTKKAAGHLIPLAVLVCFSLVTVRAWRSFEIRELSGLGESLDQVAPQTRILGLDMIKRSDFIKGQPFLQMFAYAQVIKGCELNFSFAEHGTGLVAYRSKRIISWTKALEWFAERVKRSDFRAFDQVLVNADGRTHDYLAGFKELTPVTDSGRWRLYAVAPDSGDEATDLFSKEYIFYHPLIKAGEEK